MLKLINKKRNKKGFTLVELVVVIAILGILSALAIPKLTGTQQKARDRSHEANEMTLKSAASIAVSENGAPGKKITWTDAVDTATDPVGYESDKYIEKWPTSPYTGGIGYTVTIDADGKIVVSGGEKN